MTMTATQRLYTAISGGRPDRVPTMPKIWVDLAAAITGTELREVIENPATAMGVVVEAALAVEADSARLFLFPRKHTQVVDGVLVEVEQSGEVLGPIDLQGGLATRLTDNRLLRLEDPGRVAFLTSYSTPEPLVQTIADVERIAVPDADFFEAQGYGDLQRSMIDVAGDRLALAANLNSATLAFAVLLRKMSNALVDMLEQPKLVHAIMEKGAAMAIEKGKFHLACGIKILRLNDSIANMSVISPAMWRQFILPHMRTVCEELHCYDSDARIYCHICGNVLPVIEDIVATGIDCIGPLDPLGGFTCQQARVAVGEGVSLMGGVNTLSFVNSTPEQLVDECRRCIEGAGRHGAFVLGSGCALPRGSGKDNLQAMSQAARQYGVYSCT